MLILPGKILPCNQDVPILSDVCGVKEHTKFAETFFFWFPLNISRLMCEPSFLRDYNCLQNGKWEWAFSTGRKLPLGAPAARVGILAFAFFFPTFFLANIHSLKQQVKLTWKIWIEFLAPVQPASALTVVDIWTRNQQMWEFSVSLFK